MSPFDGFDEALPQLAPPTAPGIATVSSRDGGVNNPFRAFLILSCQVRNSSSLKNKGEISSGSTVCLLKGGKVENGCVSHACSPGMSLAGTFLSSTSQTGSPVFLSKTNKKPCLVAIATTSFFLPSLLIVSNCGAAVRS